jgi:hypothetical protein
MNRHQTSYERPATCPPQSFQLPTVERLAYREPANSAAVAGITLAGLPAQ